MDLTEQWRAIPGWEGSYEVSDQGRVMSLAREVSTRRGTLTVRPRLMKLGTSPKGYRTVRLSRDGHSHSLFVHVLVLSAFVGARPERHECCHADRNPGNNTLTNLRWDTRSENALDKVKHGTHPFASKSTCPRGHTLAAPNLVAATAKIGHRACKACNRAYATCRVAKRKGEALDFMEVAEAHYQKIVG